MASALVLLVSAACVGGGDEKGLDSAVAGSGGSDPADGKIGSQDPESSIQQDAAAGGQGTATGGSPASQAGGSANAGTGGVTQDSGTGAISPDAPGVIDTGTGGVTQDSGTGAISLDAAGGNEPELGLRCQADASLPQLTDYGQPGPHAVGILELTLTDASRPIEATAEHPAAPARTLVTRIYYPAGEAPLFEPQAPVAEGKPFPLLMYSHGYSSNRDESTTAGNYAASYGYIVVAPDFPLTALLANGGAPDVKDIPNQPGDVSFLIDRVLEFSQDPSHLLAGAVDSERIGALGVSAGGLTTLLVSLHPEYHDQRIQAAMPVAPLALFFKEPFYHETRTLPLLFVQGDLDAFLDYEHNARRAFERAWPNARLITVAGGSHAAFALPIDEALQQLIATLVVPPEWNLDNPDAMGCAAVGETLQESGFGVLETLSGSDHYIDYTVSAADEPICQGDELTMPAMGIEEQRGILAESVVAFFDAHLATTVEQRQDGCRYLLHELPKHPAVTIE